jgi:hypothetical protein
MPNFSATRGDSSTLTLVTVNLPVFSPAISSTTGVSIRHGAHQGAQKSTSSGSEAFETTLSKFESFNSTTFSLAICFTNSRRARKSQIGRGNLTFLGQLEEHPDLNAHGGERNDESNDADHQTALRFRVNLRCYGNGRARRRGCRRARPSLQMHRSLRQARLDTRNARWNLRRFLLALRRKRSRNHSRYFRDGRRFWRGRRNGRRRHYCAGRSRNEWRRPGERSRLGNARRNSYHRRRLGSNGHHRRCLGGGRRNSCDRRRLWRGRRSDQRNARGLRKRKFRRSSRRRWRRDRARRDGFLDRLRGKVDHRGFARIRCQGLSVPARRKDDAHGFLLGFRHRT